MLRIEPVGRGRSLSLLGLQVDTQEHWLLPVTADREETADR